MNDIFIGFLSLYRFIRLIIYKYRRDPYIFGSWSWQFHLLWLFDPKEFQCHVRGKQERNWKLAKVIYKYGEGCLYCILEQPILHFMTFHALLSSLNIQLKLLWGFDEDLKNDSSLYSILFISFSWQWSFRWRGPCSWLLQRVVPPRGEDCKRPC